MLLLSETWNISETTSVSSSTEEPSTSVYSHPVYIISKYIWYVLPPVILLLGNFGNTMTIIIMLRTKSGDNAIDVYFIALAIMDLATLDILLLSDWVGMVFGYYPYLKSDITCKIYNWTAGSSTTGGWILVCLTTHRAISVVWPHRVNTLCTRRLVVGIISGLVVFIALVYSHYLYGYYVRFVDDTGGHSCEMIQGSYATFVAEVFTYIDLLLYSILPFTCILVANSVLVWNLRATLRDIRQTFAERDTAVAAREKAASSVTWTVLLVSCAYIVLSLPIAVYFISLFIFDPSAEISVAERARIFLIRAITFMLMFCNSAVNFYLYCLTGAKFRKEFAKLFCCAEA
ncbi:hypothetical protein ACOMHN_039987 [Nucella lapillus]